MRPGALRASASEASSAALRAFTGATLARKPFRFACAARGPAPTAACFIARQCGREIVAEVADRDLAGRCRSASRCRGRACARSRVPRALVVEVGIVREQHRHLDGLSDQRGIGDHALAQARRRRRTTGCRRAAGGRRDRVTSGNCARSALRTSAWKSPARMTAGSRVPCGSISAAIDRHVEHAARCCVKAGRPLMTMSASTTTRKIAVRAMAARP